MYAIVKTGGKQYTVKPGDVFDVEKIEGEAGDKVDLEVLFLNDGKKVIADATELSKAKVTAQIIEQHKGDKQIVFKFKKRKGYKRTKGHRQQLTRIAIVDVNGEKAEAPKPAAKKEQTPKAEAAKKEEAPKKEAPKAAEPKEEAPKAEAPKEEPKTEAPKEETAEELGKMTVAQLRELAKERDIHIPSGSRKAEIIEIILNA
ncbi:MAG: 50S ribosomal protein L21 [Coriobacteriales bacterium]